MDKAPVLIAEGVVRTLGEKIPQVVLHGIDLAVHQGEFVALTGASGSGKSTLLYLMGALDRPSAGRILIDGVDIGALDDDGRARLRNEKIGFVFQFHFLLPEFSLLENVTLPMLRRGLSEREARARALGTLDRLNLGSLSHRLPNELSGGQQQRVSIARAVAGGPAIVLADEPTGNLDSHNGELVMELFEQLNREDGVTLVMVTHNPAFAERASRRVFLKDGRVVSDEGSR
ncbi:MAG TPA: ABC transporter ATP-binding protein [Polyangia bacterium]|nr:ABC transporter ATP-binding protein [Polyangia bacterium]